MIIDRDMKPERQIYHLGGRLIEILREANEEKIEPLWAFELMNRREGISMNAFILTLDWLFILGIVDHQEGRIVKCF
jgi:hypothetical protein